MTILNATLPFAPWMAPAGQRLPGIMPLAMADWLLVNDAYAPQMAERARLLREQPNDVLGVLPESEDAAQELLEFILPLLPAKGFTLDGDRVTRPDGVSITLDRSRPLWTLGHLVQEDLCILQKPDGAAEHVLTAAVLCFPSSWTLSQKLGRAMMRIHAPVAPYDDQMGARVQRMFDMIRPEQPLWRANILRYDNPALYQPRLEFAPKDKRADGPYFRSEKQGLVRLPRTGAVVFSIHTVVVPMTALSDDQRATLLALRGHG
jgi:dimethylamine monooxygenase subunit A